MLETLNWRSTLTRVVTYSRFLIKEIVKTNNNDNLQYKYTWQYIAFATLWYIPKERPDSATQVLFCLVSPGMKKLVADGITESNPTSLCKCPFAIYDVLINAVVISFDKALWGFRKPVRDIEKVIRSNCNTVSQS